MSNKLVLWSGGCDSTLALYDALKEQSDAIHHGSSGHYSVRALTIVVGQCTPGQLRYEAAARRRATAKLKKMRLGGFTHHVVSVKRQLGDGFAHPWGGSPQAQLWVGIAAAVCRRDEDVVVGYIYGETEAVRSRPAFEAMAELGAKRGRLLTPLDMTEKPDVIARLKKIGLYDATWYCEMYGTKPKRAGQPCGDCNSCIGHRAALWKLEHFPAKFKGEVDPPRGK